MTEVPHPYVLPTTTRPCPSWCTEPAGHPFESLIPNEQQSLVRFHTLVVGSVAVQDGPQRTVALAVEITNEETVASVPAHVRDAYGEEQRDPVGPSSFSLPLVEVVGTDRLLPASAAQVRELAAVFERAAEVLEELQR